VSLSVENQQKFLMSVTHLEVNHGLLYNVNARRQCCYFERTIQGIDTALVTEKLASTYKDSVPDSSGSGLGLPDVELEHYLNDLKDQTRRTLDESRVLVSSVPWVGDGALRIDGKAPPAAWQAYLESYGAAFVRMLCESTLRDYRRPDPDPLMLELTSQLLQVQAKLKYDGFSRSAVMEQAMAYCNGTSTTASLNRAMVLYGPSGSGETLAFFHHYCNHVIVRIYLFISGKSWIMSKIVENLRGNGNRVVIFRLLGTTQDSSDSLSLLRSIVRQCAYMESDAESYRDQEWNETSEEFVKGRRLTRAQQTYLILDSIDQLSTDYGALDALADWLPGLKQDLPSNLRVIYSTLEEDKGKKLLTQFKMAMTDALPGNIISVPPIAMESNTLDYFVSCFPEEGIQFPTKRVLSPEVKQDLMACMANNPTPLFAKICLDIFLKWPSYTKSSDREALIRTTADGNGVRGLVNWIFTQLEDRHGRKFVRAALGLMTGAKDGLSEGELEDILSCDDEVLDDTYEWWTPPYRRLPPMLVQRLVMDLKGYVVSRGSKAGGVVLKWYHRQFWEAAKQRYLNTDAQRDRVYSLLSIYFAGKAPAGRFIDTQDLRRGSGQFTGQVNVRRCGYVNSFFLVCSSSHVIRNLRILCRCAQ
jgi:hypothetical protein